MKNYEMKTSNIKIAIRSDYMKEPIWKEEFLNELSRKKPRVHFTNDVAIVYVKSTGDVEFKAIFEINNISTKEEAIKAYAKAMDDTYFVYGKKGFVLETFPRLYRAYETTIDGNVYKLLEKLEGAYEEIEKWLKYISIDVRRRKIYA